MEFEAGHEKKGGRQPGVPNKVGREARELARGLLGDPEYLNSLKARLARGQAPRVEIHLWELAYGRPRVELNTAPEGADPAADFAQLLEKLGEDDKRPASVPMNCLKKRNLRRASQIGLVEGVEIAEDVAVLGRERPLQLRERRHLLPFGRDRGAPPA